jgi:putative ABC transport system permease protein
VTLVTFASIFAASAKTTFKDAVDSAFKGQAVIQNTDGFSSFSHEASREVARVPGVQTVSTVRFVTGRVGGEKTDLTGVDRKLPTLYKSGWKQGDDRLLRDLDTRSVLVGKGYAEEKGTKVGDTLDVTTPTGHVPLKVTGILNDKAGLTGDLVISNDLADTAFRSTKDNFVFIGLSPGADAKAVKKQLNALTKRDFPQVEALTTNEFKDNQAAQIDQVLGLIYALLALAIIVSLFGIVNTLVLSITERTRELGMLRAIGTSRKQVRRMIRYESVITSLIGGIIGLVLGVVLAVVVSRPIDDFTFSLPIFSLIFLLVLAGVAGMLAAILPARRAAKLDVLRALAYE